YLKRGLKADVTATLPDRFKDGYGITPRAIEKMFAQGATLILTCDNGISAIEAAERAKSLEIDLIVTDHHQLPDKLPDCLAIVHPLLEFPHLKDLAGVGVAFLLCIALEGGYTSRMDFLLDFVALGTVADVVPLDGPNRALVWKGIERVRESKKNKKKLTPGLLALGAIAKVSLDTYCAQDIGYRLGPRLNAAGRLESPDVGFDLLVTNDPLEAGKFAQHIDGLNQERQKMNAAWEKKLIERLEKEWDFEEEPFVVLEDEDFPEGIVGILAGRIKEKYRVPVLLFSGHGDGAWKASGRSPLGFHLCDALTACKSNLIGFGGHSQSAGCSAIREKIPFLRRDLNEFIRAKGWIRPSDEVWLDEELPFREANERILEELDLLEPFGQSNPSPVFGILKARVIGKKVQGKRLLLRLDDGENVREVTCWSADRFDELEGLVRLTYTIRMGNQWGKKRIELVADRIERIPEEEEETKEKIFAQLEDFPSPASLRDGYRFLAENREMSLVDALEKMEEVLSLSAIAVRQVFREVGILVEKKDFWTLLEPPESDIEIEKLQSFRQYRRERS
ncbi:MAG TPA: DHHA1 domain-containing protein, partial [Chroococcales cyanobacterium]